MNRFFSSYIVGEFPHSMGMGSLSIDTVIKLCYNGGLGRSSWR